MPNEPARQTPEQTEAALLLALAREHRKQGIRGASYADRLEEQARKLAPEIFEDDPR